MFVINTNICRIKDDRYTMKLDVFIQLNQIYIKLNLVYIITFCVHTHIMCLYIKFDGHPIIRKQLRAQSEWKGAHPSLLPWL